MNIEQLLEQHLDEVAQQAEPAPDLDALMNETTRVPGGVRHHRQRAQRQRPHRQRPQRERRSISPVAAAMIAVLGTAGGVWMLNQRSGSEPVASPPSSADVAVTPTSGDPTPGTQTASDALTTIVNLPTAFPVVDNPSDGLPVTAYASRSSAAPTYSDAVIGRRVDGRLTDLVRVTAGAESQPPGGFEERRSAAVMGQSATEYVVANGNDQPDFSVVTWGDGPYFDASGGDPLKLLAALSPGTITAAPAAVDGDPPTIEIGELPDGYEVIMSSASNADPLWAGLLVGEDNFDIWVSSRNPLAEMADAVATHQYGGELRSVDVGGRPGWMFVSQDVTSGTVRADGLGWQVDDSTYAYIKVTDGSSGERVLELARSLRFVDFDTWVELYDVTVDGDDGVPTDEQSPTTEPLAIEESELAGQPNRLPVVQQPPAGMRVAAIEYATTPSPPFVEALVGREESGTIVDAVRFVVQSEPIEIPESSPPTEVTVMGQPAKAYALVDPDRDQRTVVTWGSGPYFAAEAADPLALLGMLSPGAVEGVDGDTVPSMRIGGLPDGVDLIVAPQPIFADQPHRYITIGAGRDEEPETFNVSTGTQNALAAMAVYGKTERIDVGGLPGWVSVDGHGLWSITWRVDDSTFAYLSVIDGSKEAALEYARSVTFVNVDTWLNTYEATRYDVALRGPTAIR